MLLLTLGLVAVVALIFSQQNRLKALEDQLSTVTHSAISISKGSPVINKDSTTLISKKGAPTATREQYYGIDVSHLQVDLLKFINKHDSLHFIFCKATEGISLKDDRYAENVKLTKGKKLLLGAYHFYRANDDPVKQANFFWETIQTQQLPVLPLAIDLEMKSFPGEKPAAYPNFQRDLSTLLRELTRLSGRQPILYTNYDFAQHHLTTKDLAEYPLWLADYNNKRSNPPTPDIWKQKGVVIWQKTDTYLLHHQNTDLDVYLGSLGKLLQL
jgi:lysozyme